jgi:putative redox protein
MVIAGALVQSEHKFGAPLSDEQKRRLGEIAEKTPVTKTLRRGTPITTDIVGL